MIVLIVSGVAFCVHKFWHSSPQPSPEISTTTNTTPSATTPTPAENPSPASTAPTPNVEPPHSAPIAQPAAVAKPKHHHRGHHGAASAGAQNCREIATVHFPANSTELLPEEIAKLQQGLSSADHAAGKFEVFAYCDDIGEPKWNFILSRRRADVVAKIIASSHPDLQLQTKGFGSEQPAVPNTTWKARAQNRRAEVLTCAQ